MSAAETARALAAFDAFTAAYFGEMRKLYIELGITRFDLLIVAVTDKGTSVGGSNGDREQMRLMLEGALRAVASDKYKTAHLEVRS